MKVLGLIGAIVLLTACNNAAPTATTYKQQLGGGNAATGSNNSGNSTAGDATAGKTAFTSKGCGGCHNGSVAKDFKTASTSGSYKLNATSQALNGAHPADLFSGTSTDGKNIEAYINSLSGSGTAVTANAANGEALLKSTCDVCHVGPTPPKLDKAEADIGGDDPFAGQEANHSATVAANFTDPQKKADLIAAMKARPAP